jgi:hypothetical protein
MFYQQSVGLDAKPAWVTRLKCDCANILIA